MLGHMTQVTPAQVTSLLSHGGWRTPVYKTPWLHTACSLHLQSHNTYTTKTR
jgi:hypothetical protein